MVEKTPVHAHIVESSAYALFDGVWETEQNLRSTERVFIRGYRENQDCGILKTQFVIRREYDSQSDSLSEISRYVKLSDIMVYQGSRGRGLGKAMLAELERISNRVGASEIRGIVTPSDIAETPWLLDFYSDRGFEIEPKDAGWKIRKTLTS